MIGSLVLQNCLTRGDVNKVTSIVRKSTTTIHPKLTEVVCDDFENYETISVYLKNQDIAFFCIGVYTGAVPKDVFHKITVDYTLAFAETIK